MTKGSQAIEEHVGKKYDAGEGWHWHFRKMCTEETFEDSQPEILSIRITNSAKTMTS